MRQWTGLSLVWIIACRLFGAKSLPEPLMIFYNWIIRNIFRWIFSRKYNTFIKKIHLKMQSANGILLARPQWIKLRFSETYCWQIRVNRIPFSPPFDKLLEYTAVNVLKHQGSYSFYSSLFHICMIRAGLKQYPGIIPGMGSANERHRYLPRMIHGYCHLLLKGHNVEFCLTSSLYFDLLYFFKLHAFDNVIYTLR